MQIQVRKKDKSKESGMVGEDLQQGVSEFGESEDLKYIPTDEKIPIEIRDIVRIAPQNLRAFKRALEEFIKQWD